MASYGMTAWQDQSRLWFVHLIDLEKTVYDESLPKAMAKAAGEIRRAEARRKG